MFAMFSLSLAIRFLMFLNHNVSKAKKNNIFFVIYMAIDGSKSRFLLPELEKMVFHCFIFKWENVLYLMWKVYPLSASGIMVH